MYNEETKQDALALLRPIEGSPPVSVRSVARQVGVAPGTVKKWAIEAGLEPGKDPAAAAALDPSRVAEACLKKSRAMLAGIVTLDSKSQMERATAIEKLINAHLKLTGVAAPENQTNVQINVIEELLRK